MRISGVRVGRVKEKEPNELTGLTDAELEIDARYAPIPRDSRAILRQKSLLGETYVELALGSKDAGLVDDGGKLGAGQVADTVELDEILRTFDPETRERFSTWFDQAGIAAQGNAEALNDALALLTPFAEDTDDVLAVLRGQSGATRRFVRDTGYVFDALTERKGQLRDLIRNSNRTWEAIASRDDQLADTFRVFPTFLREGRATTERLTTFALDDRPADRPAAAGGEADLADARGPRRAGPRPQGPVREPRSAGARLAARPAGHGGGARQHAADPRQARPVAAQLHADRRLPRALQARDHGLPGERRRRHAGRGAELQRHLEVAPLPAHREPREPGDARRLAVPAEHQPLEPVHRAGGLRQAAHRGSPRGVRRVPLHRQRRSAAAGAERVAARRRWWPTSTASSTAATRIAARRRHATRRRRSGEWSGQPGMFPRLQPLP